MDYDLIFEECKVMVKWLFPIVNVNLLEVLALVGFEAIVANDIATPTIYDAHPKLKLLQLLGLKVA